MGPNPYHKTDQGVMLPNTLIINNAVLQLISRENYAELWIDYVKSLFLEHGALLFNYMHCCSDSSLKK